MATVYKVEIVSHWINYTEKELEQILLDGIQAKEKKKGNEIQVTIKKRG